MSTVPPCVIDIASAMAAVSTPGRSIYESILRIFTCDPEIFDLLDDCTSSLIPEKALRKAFDWFVQTGDRSLDRRIERALIKRDRSYEDSIEMIIRMAVRQFRTTRNLYEDFDWNPFIRRGGETAADFAAMHVRKHIGAEKIGLDRDLSLLARGLDRIRPSAVDPAESARVLDKFRSIMLAAELSGQETALAGVATVKMEEVVKRLRVVEIGKFHEVRNKVAAIADRARLFDRGHLHPHLAEDAPAAIYRSPEHVFLYHMIGPIADFDGTDGWNRLCATVVHLLAEETDDQAVLDDLAATLLPRRYGS